MLDARGCWVPPPSPATPETRRSTRKTGATAIATSPPDTQTFPSISIQNSPADSASRPAGTCRIADAPLKTDRSIPTCVNDRPMSSLMNGRRGTSSAKNRSLHTCMVEPKTSVRRDLGALVMNETIAVPYTTQRLCGTCGYRLCSYQAESAIGRMMMMMRSRYVGGQH